MLISKINAQDQSQYAYFTQLNVEEPETYNHTLSRWYSSEWSQAIREELDQLKKNNIWTLVNKRNMQPGCGALSSKWFYKGREMSIEILHDSRLNGLSKAIYSNLG